jgi:hypothetical protein
MLPFHPVVVSVDIGEVLIYRDAGYIAAVSPNYVFIPDKSTARLHTKIKAHPLHRKLIIASGYSPEFKQIVAQAKLDAVESGRCAPISE